MRTILIADDVDADRKFIAARAARFGISVEVASSGKDALERAQSMVPSLIVIGTEIGGLRVCSTLRSNHNTASIHTVLMTAQDQLTTTKNWGSKHGVHAYLVKPLGEQAVNEILKPFAGEVGMPIQDSGPVYAAGTGVGVGGSGTDNRVMREVGSLLARAMGQPIDTVMKLFVNAELKKLSGPFESLSSAEYDALLQRLASRIISLDGKSRNLFLDEARKIR